MTRLLQYEPVSTRYRPYNPRHLNPDQIGTQYGWRLLGLDEIKWGMRVPHGIETASSFGPLRWVPVGGLQWVSKLPMNHPGMKLICARTKHSRVSLRGLYKCVNITP